MVLEIEVEKWEISMALNCCHPIGGIRFPRRRGVGDGAGAGAPTFIGYRRAATLRSTAITAIASDPVQAEVSWQIVVGALGTYNLTKPSQLVEINIQIT